MAKENAVALPAKVGLKEVAAQVRPMIECLGGFMIGNMTLNLANKLFKIDPTSPTEKTIKKVLPPLVLSGVSIFGTLKTKHSTAKNMLQGAAIAGVYKTAKTLAPSVGILAGDSTLGLTPVAAVTTHNDRWYLDPTSVSAMGFPDLGAIQPPEGGSGYYLDPPAYMGAPGQAAAYPQQPFIAEPEPAYYPQPVGYTPPETEQFYGEEELAGQEDAFELAGEDIEIL